MSLHIEAHWSHPLTLTECKLKPPVYKCEQMQIVPTTPGVYVFARRHGKCVSPLYIGQSNNLFSRLRQHFNSVALMHSILNAPAGTRIFMFCAPTLRRGQQLARVMDTLEAALIDHALGEGHTLFNIQGTKRPANTIDFSGNRTSEALAPRKMNLRAF